MSTVAQGVPKSALHPRPGPPARVVRLALQAVFWLWAAGLTVVGAILMVGHWYTLPAPSTEDARFAAALADLRFEGEPATWMAVHVLYSKCRCSQQILDHLLESKRPGDMRERILLVGAHPEYARRARKKGFIVQTLEPRELKETYQIEAAPLLVVIDPLDRVRYAGGYTDRKQGPAVHDLTIFERLIEEDRAPTLPLFGCGVSKELQRLLDPIGIKYGRTP